jgi:hypothetical protein
MPDESTEFCTSNNNLRQIPDVKAGLVSTLSTSRQSGASVVEAVAVRIVRFVDDAQPGWVACELTDAFDRRHTLVDKAPVFTAKTLDADGPYPEPGVIACEVVERWQDGEGRRLARVTTARPFGVESTEGVTEFVVLSEQVIGFGNQAGASVGQSRSE